MVSGGWGPGQGGGRAPGRTGRPPWGAPGPPPACDAESPALAGCACCRPTPERSRIPVGARLRTVHSPAGPAATAHPESPAESPIGPGRYPPLPPTPRAPRNPHSAPASPPRPPSAAKSPLGTRPAAHPQSAAKSPLGALRRPKFRFGVNYRARIPTRRGARLRVGISRHYFMSIRNAGSSDVPSGELSAYEGRLPTPNPGEPRTRGRSPRPNDSKSGRVTPTERSDAWTLATPTGSTDTSAPPPGPPPSG
jgi:hypothetical protein